MFLRAKVSLSAELVLGLTARTLSNPPSCLTPDPHGQHGLSALNNVLSLLFRSNTVFHTVIFIRDSFQSVCDRFVRRIYQIRHVRASNLVWVPTTEPGPAPHVVETDANLAENERDIIEYSQPARNPDELLIRTRNCRFVRQLLDSNFEYLYSTFQVSIKSTSVQSCILVLASLNALAPCGPANLELLAIPQVHQARSDAIDRLLNATSEERDLLGFSHIRHVRPNYCFTEEWKKFAVKRSRQKLDAEHKRINCYTRPNGPVELDFNCVDIRTQWPHSRYCSRGRCPLNIRTCNRLQAVR